MSRKQAVFAVSTGIALIWLTVSTLLAVPWIRSVAQEAPEFYVVWVVIGIALLPGYLMSAMFISNLMNTNLPGMDQSVCEPIAVLICARNEQASIYRTIEQVAYQSYDGILHILCIDNGSTDGTREETERAMASLQSDKRTIQLIQCDQRGKANALNMGLSLIDTRFFVTVDADTFLEETAIAAIVGRIADAGAGCVAGNLLVKDAASWVQKMQIYDYLISIAAVKRYQGSCGTTLVAQGAFSAYDTLAVRSAGGWIQCAGEDIVLTYRLLGQGRLSLYEPRAVGYTIVPKTLMELGRQRLRWARGMFEGFHAVKPWEQPIFYAGYFETLNLSIVYLDLAYVFGFLAGVLLLALGFPWFVGWMTLLMLPISFIGALSVYIFQKKLDAVAIQNSFLGGLCFVLIFQAIQSLCSLMGYAQAIGKNTIRWK